MDKIILREASKKNWLVRDAKNIAATDELQVGCQQRMADALERSATAHESLAKNGQRTVELHELHLKPKADLDLANARLKTENKALQIELMKAYEDRDHYKKSGLEIIASKSHLYRRIAALKGVITRTKKAR